MKEIWIIALNSVKQLQIKYYFKSMREDNIKAGICATITI